MTKAETFVLIYKMVNSVVYGIFSVMTSGNRKTEKMGSD